LKIRQPRCHIPGRSEIEATAAGSSAARLTVQTTEHPKRRKFDHEFIDFGYIVADAAGIVVSLIAALVVWLGVTRLSHTPVNL
jgi:hypothetical protein